MGSLLSLRGFRGVEKLLFSLTGLAIRNRLRIEMVEEGRLPGGLDLGVEGIPLLLLAAEVFHDVVGSLNVVGNAVQIGPFGDRHAAVREHLIHVPRPAHQSITIDAQVGDPVCPCEHTGHHFLNWG